MNNTAKGIIVDNTLFPESLGIRVVKLKYEREKSSPIPEYAALWDEIQPLTFANIAEIPSQEQRRIALKYFPIDELLSSVQPDLADTKTIKKTTTWVNKKGVTESVDYTDVYSLYKVSSDKLGVEEQNWNAFKEYDYYFIKCLCTSTGREYLIWVDIIDVLKVNSEFYENKIKNVDAIGAIAWTITTNIPEGQINIILRQGDCILIKPKSQESFLSAFRHLTREEYLGLLKIES